MAYRVIQWATGATGSYALRSIIQDSTLELAGLYVHSDEKNGMDAGEFCRMNPVGVKATNDIETIMAIDADLNAGLIDQEDARTRRKEISDEAEFYGSMDGASKFVRGDAVAGILILFINILGGLLIGVALLVSTIDFCIPSIIFNSIIRTKTKLT